MNTNNIIAGLLVGMLVGATGMGGGSLMAPILIYVFHYRAKYAVGSDLLYVSIAKCFGAWQHRAHGNVNFKLVGYLALGSVPSSLVGVWLVHSLDKRHGLAADHILEKCLGATLVLVAAIMIVRSFPQVDAYLKRRGEGPVERKPIVAVAVGVLGGFLVGLTSVGGGTLFGAALLLIFGLGTREMVGTDIFHAAILSGAAAAGHIWAGDVDYPLVASLLVGAIPGILIGGHISQRVPDRAMRPTIATVLLLAGLRILL